MGSRETSSDGGLFQVSSRAEQTEANGGLLICGPNQRDSGTCFRRSARSEQFDSRSSPADMLLLFLQVLHKCDPEFTQYAYMFLRSGLDITSLPKVTEAQLKEECHVRNSVHRHKILSYLQGQNPHLQVSEVTAIRVLLDSEIEMFSLGMLLQRSFPCRTRSNRRRNTLMLS